MKTILELLHELKRDDVAEFAMVSGRFPCVKVHGAFQPIDDVATSTRVIERTLEALDAGDRLKTISAQPTQWETALDGIGAVTVLAVRKGDVMQVRIMRTQPKKRASRRAPPVITQSFEPTPRMPSARPPKLLENAVIEPPPRSKRSSMQPPVSPVKPISFHPAAGDDPLAEFLVGARKAKAPTLAIEETRDELELDDGSAAPSSGIGIELDVASGGTLDLLLRAARDKGASDLHVIAGRPPLFRLAGELVPEGKPLPANVVEGVLIERIPERLRVSFHNDGSCDFALSHEKYGRFRVNVTRQRTGLKGSFRVIPHEVPTLTSLGLPPELNNALKHHQGLIVVTGPTGHGKTTTLAALVGILNETTTHHVITVEDPIEFLHPRKKAMISQREVGTHTKSFESALKGSLREDPDVIVVGELRDTETVRMALSASETGHLVIGTMNTPSAAKTIDRLIDLFPPSDQQQVRMTLAGGLRMIVSQRLVPNVARNGMLAAAEVLPGSIALWNLIRDSKTFQIPSLQQRGRAVGIVRLDDSLAELVRDGKASLEVVLPFAEDPDELAGKTKAVPPPGAAPAAPPRPNAGAAAAGAAKDLFSRAGAIFGKKP